MTRRTEWDPYGVNPLMQREVRQAYRRGLLGPDPCCMRCGVETRLPALTRVKSELVCYECQCEAEGRPRIEYDHPLGRSERVAHYTVPTRGNDHRELSDPDVGPEARLRAAAEPDPQLKRLLRLPWQREGDRYSRT